MKIEPVVKIASPSSRLEVYPDGFESAACFCGGRKILSIRRIKTGNFDEALGLVEKLRRHLANDGLSAEIDSENVIPFGCEYHVRRHWNCAGDIFELTDDISADNGGRITDLALEEIVFCGPAEKVEYLLDGEENIRTAAASGVICETARLPLLVRVIFADGMAAEFYSGDDFFRHQGASTIPGASAQHRIFADEEGVHWVRQVLITSGETEVEKRPWRFKTLFAVSAAEAGTAPETAENIALDGCFAAPALHREFRNFVRKSSAGNIRLTVSGKIQCCDGSHISRPGKKVVHGMLGEIFDDYIWASGIAAKRSGSFTAEVKVAGLENSVICGNLLVPAAVLEYIEPEEEF